MIGLSRHTGGVIDFDAHLSQSIEDILTTPLGSRVMRRDYGSQLPRLIDAPLNGETQIDLFAAVAEALATWEPRLRLVRVSIDQAEAGRIQISMLGETLRGTTTVTSEVRSAA
jgi:phage baseplate assembly protein W